MTASVSSSFNRSTKRRVQHDYRLFHAAGEGIDQWILLNEHIRHLDAERRARDLELCVKVGHCFGVTLTALAINATRMADSPVHASNFFSAESTPGIAFSAANAFASAG